MDPEEFYSRNYEAGTKLYFPQFFLEDRKTLEQFHTDRLAGGDVRPRRQNKVIRELLTVQQHYLKVPFTTATLQDIKNAVKEINASSRSEWTKHDFKVILKTFFKWYKPNQAHELIGWVKIGMPKNREPKPEDAINETDTQRLIAACDNPMDKALVALLFDAIIRVYELGTMNVGDVSNETEGVYVRYTGKTGSNKVVVPFAGTFLLEWLRVHPKAKDPTAPLWVKHNKGKGDRLKYSGLYARLALISKQAGFTGKKTNPQNWRRSSTANWIRLGLTGPVLAKRGKWTQDSKAVRAYFSMFNKDADDAVLVASGKKKPAIRKSELTPLQCGRCKTENEYSRDFCKVCGQALTVEAALKAAKKKERLGKDEIERIVEARIKEAFKKHLAVKKN